MLNRIEAKVPDLGRRKRSESRRQEHWMISVHDDGEEIAN